MVDPLTNAAIGWGLSAAGWLISPVLTRFLNKCFDALGIDPSPRFQSRKQTLLAKLDKLQTTLLPQLLILTDAAQQSPHRRFLEKWLQKLKSTFYEAEHVLGLLEYAQLEKQVNSLFPSSSSKFNMKNLKDKLPKISSEKNDLIQSLENLEKVVNEAMEFVPILNLPSSSSIVANSNWKSNEQYRETISTPGSTVIGRDKDRDDILKLLKEDFPESSNNARCYSIIGIWGMGGSGKTTLAQYVCDYEKEVKYFDKIIWVHVSENFNVRAIMRSIWESVLGSSCSNYESSDVLSSQLADNLRGQKYLLVLDDVWCNQGVNEQKLSQLFAPLRDGKRGSKILVTTRNEEVARAMGAMNLIKLRELDDQEFFSLFMTHSLRDVKVNDHLEERLREIGLKIVGKLCRLPLAAILVAGQLRRQINPEFWLSMLNKRLIIDIMGALYLSYQNLHPALQRCFAYCSLLSKGYYFEKSHVISLWIAGGFIETDDNNEHVKDIANRYFLELISCSLFQAHKDNNYLYCMHDLIHDLAQHVSQGECFKIESGETKEIPIQTRHLYVVTHMFEEYVDKICKLKDLCTIFINGSSSSVITLEEVHLDALFKNLRKLYIVDLPHIEVLPKSLIHLNNLRYLKFAISQYNVIPKSLNKLYQLRTLHIWSARHFLRNKIIIPDVGRLILLQDLGEFHVRTSRGFELKQLEHLNDLSGMLVIRDLHNVTSKEEAHQAKLDEKRGIESLYYCWKYGSEDVLRDIDVEILESLCPPSQTKRISIEGYSGKRLCSWILENNKIPNLNHLELLNFQGLATLQNINKLSNLLSLTICNLPRLKSWEPLPSRLTQLKLTNCISLVFGLKKDLEMIASIRSMQISRIVTFLESCSGQNSYVSSVKDQFRCVQDMMKLGHHIDEQALSIISKDLKKCLEKRYDIIFQLTNVYGELYLPHVLEKLTIGSCFITDQVLAVSLQGLNFLTHLKFWDIITFTCVPKEVLSSLTSLVVLEIRNCLLLTLICGWDTHITLRELKLECCPNLTVKPSVVANSCSCVELSSTSSCKRKNISSILNCVSLQQCLPSDDMFQNLVSLETLDIWDCPTIVNPYIGYMKSLVQLKFHGCSNFVSLRGLSELTELTKLHLIRCQMFECYSDTDKLPQLEELSVSKLSQLEQLISKDGMSSLVALTLQNAQEGYFSQQEFEVFWQLSSLEAISFVNCKMHSLPALLCLGSLRSVHIIKCSDLIYLSEMPSSVKEIKIRDCSEEFTRSCEDSDNPNSHKISHIPKKDILLHTFSTFLIDHAYEEILQEASTKS